MNEARRVQASTLEGTIFPLRFLVGLCDRGAGRAALGLPTSENSQERPLREKDLQPRQCGSHNLNYTAAPRSCLRGRSCPEGLGCPERCRGCSGCGCGASRPSTPGSSLVSLLEAERWGQELELVSGEGLMHGVSPRPRPPAVSGVLVGAGTGSVQCSARTPEAGMTFAGSFSEVRLDSGQVRVTRLCLEPLCCGRPWNTAWPVLGSGWCERWLWPWSGLSWVFSPWGLPLPAGPSVVLSRRSLLSSCLPSPTNEMPTPRSSAASLDNGFGPKPAEPTSTLDARPLVSCWARTLRLPRPGQSRCCRLSPSPRCWKLKGTTGTELVWGEVDELGFGDLKPGSRVRGAWEEPGKTIPTEAVRGQEARVRLRTPPNSPATHVTQSGLRFLTHKMEASQALLPGEAFSVCPRPPTSSAGCCPPGWHWSFRGRCRG